MLGFLQTLHAHVAAAAEDGLGALEAEHLAHVRAREDDEVRPVAKRARLQLLLELTEVRDPRRLEIVFRRPSGPHDSSSEMTGCPVKPRTAFLIGRQLVGRLRAGENHDGLRRRHEVILTRPH